MYVHTMLTVKSLLVVKRNLDDSDVAPLAPSDFEGCGPRVQAEYVIHFAELCVMICYVVRERFGLRVSAEHRKAVLGEADEALANWSLRLPDNLRLRASDVDTWSAMLHLTYNNFLILLHRPHPRASAYSDDYGPHDAEICSAAAGVISSIFEELRLNNRLKFLWYSGVHTLFTAMIQVRVELRFSNPVLAINALRRFHSASYSLRELSDYWAHAGTILRLFENSKRLQEDLRMAPGEKSRKFSGGEEQKGYHHQPQRSSSDTTSAVAAGSIGTGSVATKHAVSASNTTAVPSSSNNSNNNSAARQAPDTENLVPYEIPAPESSQIHDPSILLPQNNQFLDSWVPTHLKLNNYPFARSDEPSNMASSVDAREQVDWRQLFSFSDLAQPVTVPMEDVPDFEDEWREIYWQETPFTDLLQDGSWMHS